IARLPLGWFDPGRIGGLGRLTSKGVVTVMGVPAHLLRPIVTAFVTPATVVVAMAFFDWRLALCAAISAPLLVLTYRWTGNLVVAADTRAHTAAAEANARLVEFAQSQAVLRAFGRTDFGARLLDDALLERRNAGRALLSRAVPGLIGFILVVQLAFTVLLFAGTGLALHGSIETGKLIAILVLGARYVEPLITAADLGSALRMADNSVERMRDLLDTAPLVEPETPATLGGPEIAFHDVSFGYGDKAVLEHVDFTVAPATMTAIVGPSGSGKTTVARLVARFFDVDTGRVTIGGTDVRELGTEQVMRQVSIVFQDVYLFAGTIMDNIR
ncbi:ABC transporter ATP-binding protein, partial [Streptomyces sp. SID3343]|uniref:ATP-binding cassette domain-containing protein n=1 Tax=Streptomyces sp. SID3343 TaxID=2690260 RepID=UPI00136B95B4